MRKFSLKFFDSGRGSRPGLSEGGFGGLGFRDFGFRV